MTAPNPPSVAQAPGAAPAARPGRGRTIGLIAGWVVVSLIAGVVAIAVAVDGDEPATAGAAAVGDGTFGTGRPDGTATPPSGTGTAPPAAATPDLPADGLPDGAMTLFEDPGAGFTTAYPADWIAERDGGTTIFSGREGTEAYAVTFAVQVVLTAQAGGDYADATSMYQVMRGQIQSAGGQVLAEDDGSIPLSIGDRPTATMVAIYPQDPQQPLSSPVMQMVATVFAVDETRLIAVTYTAPQELYDTYSEVASMMFALLDVIG